VPFFGLFFLAAVLTTACKSEPVSPAPETPAPLPSASLAYKGIEAGDLNHLDLLFTLGIINAGHTKIESWHAEVNGQKAGSALMLKSNGNDVLGLNFAQSPLSIPLTLNMNMAALNAEGLAPSDEYNVKLIIELLASNGSSPLVLEVSSHAAFPGVRAPAFSIISIAVIKAELINTRFRVNMKIDNPNPFPVNLSSFAYELYGNGRLWADGTEKNVFTVSGKSSMTAELFLLMNFIGMERTLLDQIIKLVDVNYRFAGEAQVTSEVEYLPKFSTGFDLSGYSRVLEK